MTRNEKIEKCSDAGLIFFREDEYMSWYVRNGDSPQVMRCGTVDIDEVLDMAIHIWRL